MILFLRDSDNNTIVDVEIYKKDKYVELHSSVIISEYSKLLLANSDKETTIRDFDKLSELRGWFWEVYAKGHHVPSEEYSEALNEVRSILKHIGERYNLILVED